MVDVSQAGDLSNRGSVTPELVGMDDLWNIVFSQRPGQKGLRRFGVPMPLKENVEHESVLVHGPPAVKRGQPRCSDQDEPVANAIDARTDLVHMPSGTLTGFPMAQFFGEERYEFYAPFAEGFVTDLDAALVEQFLNVPVAQRKAMIEPDGVLDGDHGETVAVWFGVGHGQSDYPDPIKATQPAWPLTALPDIAHGLKEADVEREKPL